MNDDDAAPALEALKAEHRRLDAEIRDLIDRGASDQLEIARLKKRKLMLKDHIAQLRDNSVPDLIA